LKTSWEGWESYEKRRESEPFVLAPQPIASPGTLKRLARCLRERFPGEVVGFRLEGGLERAGGAEPRFRPYALRLVADEERLDPFLKSLLDAASLDRAYPEFFEGCFYCLPQKTAYRFDGQFHHDPGPGKDPGEVRVDRALSGEIDWGAVNRFLASLKYRDAGANRIRLLDGTSSLGEFEFASGPARDFRADSFLIETARARK